MDEKTRYAEEWNDSASFFYQTKVYDWMIEQIGDKKCVLEVGCGTGYSTLALLQAGYNVVAVDNNSKCLKKASELILGSALLDRVIFELGDITDKKFQLHLLEKYEFEVVLCWNVGTYFTKKKIKQYLPLWYDYGLTKTQIEKNYESSYVELILFTVCKFAFSKKCPVHIVERIAEDGTHEYYDLLAKEIGYENVIYEITDAESVSRGGRTLVFQGVEEKRARVKLKLLSILFSKKGECGDENAAVHDINIDASNDEVISDKQLSASIETKETEDIKKDDASC